jgi:hypothetical protein
VLRLRVKLTEVSVTDQFGNLHSRFGDVSESSRARPGVGRPSTADTRAQRVQQAEAGAVTEQKAGVEIISRRELQQCQPWQRAFAATTKS